MCIKNIRASPSPWSPNKDTKLRTMYGLKSFYKNPRNHLRNCSTQGKHEVKNCETGEKNCFILSTTAPSSSQHKSAWLMASLLVLGCGGWMVERVSNILGFRGLHKDWLLSGLIQSANETGLFGCRRWRVVVGLSAESKGEQEQLAAVIRSLLP